MRVSLTSILSVVLVCFIEAGWASHAENFDTEGNTTSPKGLPILISNPCACSWPSSSSNFPRACTTSTVKSYVSSIALP
eukprot:jgi/Mesen1/7225/ME000372S06462